jgi:hypothetical protein
MISFNGFLNTCPWGWCDLQALQQAAQSVLLYLRSGNSNELFTSVTFVQIVAEIEKTA